MISDLRIRNDNIPGSESLTAVTPEIYVSPRKRVAPQMYRTHFPVSRVYLDTLRKSTAARKQKHNHTQLRPPSLLSIIFWKFGLFSSTFSLRNRDSGDGFWLDLKADDDDLIVYSIDENPVLMTIRAPKT